MVKLISYPFRIDSRGRVITIEDNEDYHAEELAVLIQTVPGERTLVPDYGISDPTFSSISKVELIDKIEMFGPPVVIGQVKSQYLVDGRLDISIEYNPAEDSEDSDLNDGNDSDTYYEPDEDTDFNNATEDL